MKLWEDLTLNEQIAHAGWTRPAPDRLEDTRSPAVLHGPGLVAQWVRWLAAHPDRLEDGVSAYLASQPPIRWYPRPGDWVVYTHRAERGGVYRRDCSGQLVRVMSVGMEQLDEDQPAQMAYRVQGWWDGFNRRQLVRWSAYPGEVEPADPAQSEAAEATLCAL